MTRHARARPSRRQTDERRGGRRQRRPRKPPSVVPYVVFGLAVTYSLALAVFALSHYDGPRPGVGRVVKDFHGYLGLGPTSARADPEPIQVAEPVRRPEPTPRVVVEREPSKLDLIARTLREVKREAPVLRTLGRGKAFDDARYGLLNRLTDARDTLGEILDAEPDNDRANALWDRLQGLQAAVRKY